MHISSDQATGLRELLKRSRQRLLPVLGSGATQHWVSAMLAEALARSGQRILLIEQGTGECARMLGATPRRPLADAMTGACDLADAVGRSTTGARVIVLDQPSAVAPGRSPGRRLLELAAQAEDPAELVLIHCTEPRTVARFLDAEGEILLVTGADPEAVQSTYVNIKRTCVWPHRYRTLVVGERTESQAMRVHERIAAAAGRFLGVAAAFAGFLPGARPRHQLPVDPVQAAIARIAGGIAGWNLAEFRGARAADTVRAALH